MADLTLRLIKGSPLTHEELDENFIALDQQLSGGDTATNTIGIAEPISPLEGDIWFDTGNEEVSMYDGSSWVPLPSGGTAMSISNTAPVSPDTGEMWLDTNIDIVKVYDGSIWFEMPSSSSSSGSIDAGIGGDDF